MGLGQPPAAKANLLFSCSIYKVLYTDEPPQPIGFAACQHAGLRKAYFDDTMAEEIYFSWLGQVGRPSKRDSGGCESIVC